MLFPNNITTEHITLLFDVDSDILNSYITDNWSNNYEEYLERSVLLERYQYTFKKYISDWENVLVEYGSFSISDILRKRTEIKDKKIQKLIMTIIIDCLCRLYSKWDLTKDELSNNASCYETALLLRDGIIDRRDICNYYLGGSSNASAIAEKISNYHKKLSFSDGYKILPQFNNNTINDISVHINSRSSNSLFKLISSNGSVIDICSISSINDLLLKLWKNGTDIRWNDIYLSNEYQKTSLPVYRFCKNSFWIEHIDRLRSGLCTSSAEGPLSENEKCSIWEEKSVPVVYTTDKQRKRTIILLSEDDRFCNALYEKQSDNIISMIVLSQNVIHCVNDNITTVRLKNISEAEISASLSIFVPFNDDLEIIIDWCSLTLEDRISPLCLIHMLYKVLYMYKKTDNVTLLSVVSGKNDRETALACESLFKSLYCENNGIVGMSLELPNDTSAEEKAERAGIFYDSFGTVCSDGKTYERIYDKTVSISLKELNLRKDGVYLITGGMGKLGTALAERLVSEEQIHLILIGRREPDDDIRAELANLERNGSSAEYLSLDISDCESVTCELNNVLKKYYSINGIFHAAGSYKTGYFITKSEKDMRDIVYGKINGAYVLDEFISDMDIDFFVMVSSVSSIIGDEGIADYTFANGCLNSLAREREKKRLLGLRKGKTYSVALPVIENGGMKFNKSIIDTYAQKTGFGAIKKEVAAEYILSVIAWGYKWCICSWLWR